MKLGYIESKIRSISMTADNFANITILYKVAATLISSERLATTIPNLKVFINEIELVWLHLQLD